jgi:heterotetrameric sarcosine oxidase gamma subunit
MYFIQRHPLEDVLPAHAAAVNADHLTVLLRPTVLSVLAQADTPKVLPDVSVRACGPLEWLMVSEEIGADALGRSLTAEGVQWVDQTHAYAVVRLSGPNARAILAKGIAVDLHPAAFTIGQSANALCGQIHVNLACVGDDVFELMVPRSYASFFFQDIMQAGREFSLSAAFGAML